MNIAAKLHEAFNQFPKNIAISEDNRNLTYNILYKNALKVAAFLINKKIKNDCVAIELTNATEHITCLLGIVFSGNYYASITEENRPFFLEAINLKPAFIICNDDVAAVNSASFNQIIKQKNVDAAVIKNTQIKPHNALCAFFTSGSTGKSKIIIHTHQNILNDTERQIEENKITQTDKLDLVFSLSFSASLACIFPAFLSGAELCIFNLKENGLMPLAKFWQRKSITFSTLSVSTFQGLCKISVSFKHLSSLRFVSISAEPVKDTTIAFFKSKFPAHTILQIAYASTETRTIAEIKIYNDGKSTNFVNSVGKVVRSKQIIICDADGKKLPAGETGEIIVQSKYIAEKYLGQPEESRKAFTKEGDIISYKTGDVGYINNEGYLFYCGRITSENKINGVKINLAHIEEAVEKIEGILQAAVVINTSQFEQPKLVCFYKKDGAAELHESIIKSRLAGCLPFSHFPNFLIPVSEFPYTHSGKINRKELEQIALSKQPLNNKIDTIPTSEYEQIVISVFRQTLETENINADSNFYDCGGDSLSTLLCIAEIEDKLGITFPTFEFANNSTPKKLTDFITKNNSEEPILVKEVFLNGYNEKKQNLYFLNHSVNNIYKTFLNTSIADKFNLIELLYELHKGSRLTKGADIIIQQAASIIRKQNNALVMGYSFNGFIAYQLSCIVPQISFCILIDTYDYFNYTKYKVKNRTKDKFKIMLWQLIKNKDYVFPYIWMKRNIKMRHSKKQRKVRTSFLSGINYLLDTLNNKSIINNCIYFQANHSFLFVKNHGMGWKQNTLGDFHFFNFPSDHKNVISENSNKMAKYITKVVATQID